MVNKKVLIVDDEPINLSLLDNVINPIHTVFTSTQGRDTIDKAIELSPDLTLLDIMLP